MNVATADQVSTVRRVRHPRNWRKATPYIFISPFYIVFIVFFLGPIVSAFIISFQKWTGVNTAIWTGFSNYQQMFSDQVFQTSVVNTFIYMSLNLAVLIPVPLLLAVALNAKLTKGKGLLRAIFFSPYLTAPVAVSLVFLTLFDWHFGLFNQVLKSVGLTTDGINWTGSQEWVKIAVSIVIVWRWVGYNSVYFLAGLTTIPQDIYEAAVVDGARAWDNFIFITLPMLRPVLLFVGVVSTIGAAQIFDEPTMLTGPNQMMGTPGFSSLTLAQEIFRQAFMNFNFGYAAAMAVLMFITLATLSWLQYRFLRGGRI